MSIENTSYIPPNYSFEKSTPELFQKKDCLSKEDEKTSLLSKKILSADTLSYCLTPKRKSPQPTTLEAIAKFLGVLLLVGIFFGIVIGTIAALVAMGITNPWLIALLGTFGSLSVFAAVLGGPLLLLEHGILPACEAALAKERNSLKDHSFEELRQKHSLTYIFDLLGFETLFEKLEKKGTPFKMEEIIEVSQIFSKHPLEQEQAKRLGNLLRKDFLESFDKEAPHYFCLFEEKDEETGAISFKKPSNYQNESIIYDTHVENIQKEILHLKKAGVISLIEAAHLEKLFDNDVYLCALFPNSDKLTHHEVQKLRERTISFKKDFQKLKESFISVIELNKKTLTEQLTEEKAEKAPPLVFKDPYSAYIQEKKISLVNEGLEEGSGFTILELVSSESEDPLNPELYLPRMLKGDLTEPLLSPEEQTAYLSESPEESTAESVS